MEEFNFMTLGKFVRVVGNKQSGVYLIRDKGNRVVYVGKAVDLKNRIKDHFNGHTNTQVHSIFFYEVAFTIENSPIKRSMIETNLMFEYKPVFNKEVQEEFLDLYNEYLKDNSRTHQNIPAVKDALEEKRRREERKEIRKLK
ncbi:nucleotide excision repair endonuclease [Bacillus pseudomycoides]|uniref:nucleotide excision repair endonuclease n=1 Tax=Bacillus pseudomycoides TaxID=64104 RepID=UPI0020D27727|nr:nucleotide excision repair endonuclease [Bacillus pseudomycoides]